MSPISEDYTPGAGLPLGLPLGSAADDTSAQVSDSTGPLRGPNTWESSDPVSGAGPAVTRASGRRRVTAAHLSRLIEQMAERDEAVLQQIAAHRFLTTIQLQHLVFTDHDSDASAARTTRRVLARLERWGLIRMLHRRIGGVRAGSSARIWRLAPPGARIVAADGAAYRASEPSLRFLRHCLAVADVHVLLRQHLQIETIDSVHVQVEPKSWRRYTGPTGEPRWLQPDLAATLVTDDYIDRWFIEVDLGTESLPTLLRKCEQYEAYRQSGTEQAAHRSFPLVLWLFTDPARAKRLHEAIARSPRLTPAMYRVAVPRTVAAVLSGGPT